jgi:hypothetical protein
MHQQIPLSREKKYIMKGWRSVASHRWSVDFATTADPRREGEMKIIKIF